MERAADPPRREAHTLTLEFGRLLSEDEWRDVVTRARQLPYVQHLKADVVSLTAPRVTT